MENENLNQHQAGNSGEIVEARIRLSRDNKWIIIRLDVDGKPISVIKSVNYFKKILERIGTNMPYNIETIKG